MDTVMEPWQYDPARDLDQPMLERLRRFPREPDMLVYGLRLAAAGLTRGWLRLYHRLSISGGENLPAEGSFVLVANHASHLDALCLLSTLPLAKIHRAFPVAAQDYFFANVPRMLLAVAVVNALPFDRTGGPRQSLALCKQLLENPGNILLLFPEGTRSPSGDIGEFKAGVGRLARGRRAFSRGALLSGGGTQCLAKRKLVPTAKKGPCAHRAPAILFGS
jgi:1-acyl-sn-glycerol-3-phosphate acyltransferase